MQTKRIVVTGIGTLNPLGNNLSEYWENLVNGVSGADIVTQFDASKFKTKFACEIKGFDATAFTRDYLQQLTFAKANDSGSATLSFAPVPGSILIGFENIPDANYGQ